MKGYFRSWDIMRIFRLLLSVAVIIGGATTKDWTLTSLGGLFCFMQIFNVGCCCATSCCTPLSKTDSI